MKCFNLACTNCALNYQQNIVMNLSSCRVKFRRLAPSRAGLGVKSTAKLFEVSPWCVPFSSSFTSQICISTGSTAQGNLLEISSYDTLAAGQSKDHASQRTKFNPAFQFAPPKDDFPTFRMTASLPQVTVPLPPPLTHLHPPHPTPSILLQT